MITLPVSLRLFVRSYWGYERAFATNFIAVLGGCHCPDGESELVDDMHRQCWEAIGAGPDNKQTYECIAESESTRLYLTFHDNKLYIGLGIRPYGSGALPPPSKTVAP